MAQHDFVPAWLQFSRPLPSKSPGASLEQPGQHLSRGDARSGVRHRRRHYSSDGFFNYDFRASAGDGWQKPSLLRHDSVDSAVARRGQGGMGGTGGKEPPGWHGVPGSQEGPLSGRPPKRNGRDKERERHGPLHQRNGNFHPQTDEERQEDKLKFVEEDFPSLNSEMSGIHAVGTPTGVWENPPSAKQTRSKMLVIKKVSKEDSSTSFSAGFANTGFYQANCTKALVTGLSIYKNLTPKPATTPIKTGPWKPQGRETKSSSDCPGRDLTCPSPAPATKAAPSANTPTPPSSREVSVPHLDTQPPASTSPPIDVTPSRLKLMRRSTDRKSEFLQGLKDWRNGGSPGSSSPPGPGEGEGSTPEAEDYDGHENGISHLLSDHLSSSLEEEHRLLKAMGWQEHPENDDNFLPLTEDELREFQVKSEQVASSVFHSHIPGQLKRNGWRQNDVRGLPKPRGAPLPLAWRNPVAVEEGSDSETSSSQTSDDEEDE